MGWFGMPNMNKEEAFAELFSQSQYKNKFELIWEKHFANRSIAVYTLDDMYFGETILWSDDGEELMYKPLSWTSSIDYIPRRLLVKLIYNATPFEVKCYEEYAKKHRLSTVAK